MQELMEEILENALGNIYFFLSEEANAPNNTSTNLGDLIRKAKPIADIINRHINIYGFNPDEGINFVARVMPGGDISPDKMVIAESIPNEIVQCTLAKEDIAKVMKIAALPQLISDMLNVTEGHVPIIKNPWFKKRQKRAKEEEAVEKGFSPDDNIFNEDEDDTENLRDVFGSENNEDDIQLIVED